MLLYLTPAELTAHYVPAGCTYSMQMCEGASTLLLAKLPTHGEELLYCLLSAAACFVAICQQDGQHSDPWQGSTVVWLHTVLSLQALNMQALARPLWKLCSQNSCLYKLRMMQMQVRIWFFALCAACCCLTAA